MTERPWWYAHMPPERAEAVEKWLTTPLNDCRICGEPVFPTSSRTHDEKYQPPEAPENETTEAREARLRPHVVHLACFDAEQAESDSPTS